MYAVDPGDMRTRMHQEAFPGEDISDRPPPEQSVPGIVELIEGALPSGRYQARALLQAASSLSALAFTLPPGLEATAPAEHRGLARDGVRLLVADAAGDSLIHARFHELPALLAPGDLVVVNVSATLPAAVAGRRGDGRPVRVHVATRAPRPRRQLAGRRAAHPRWRPARRAAGRGRRSPSPATPQSSNWSRPTHRGRG